MQCEVVVSCENNAYMMWQAMLFHYSCVSRLGQVPVVVVHLDGGPLLPGFEMIRSKGGTVQTAPNYRRISGVNYPPRNTAATLKHVRTSAPVIMLCDPDMVFLRAPEPPDGPWHGNAVTFDRLTYLHTDDRLYRPLLKRACLGSDVPFDWLVSHPINGGVPYFIPTQLQKRISDDWLFCMSLFPTHPPADVGPASLQVDVGPQQYWLTVMWAIVLSMHRLCIDVGFTECCTHNFDGDRLVESTVDYAMVHYCYPTAGFDKRTFDTRHTTDSGVWTSRAANGTINELVCEQLREAGEYFGLNS